MIVFWAIVIVLTGVVVTVLVRTAFLASDQADPSETDKDSNIYKAQLAEVERDLERGTISKEDAESLRAEIARKLLAAHGASQPQEKRATPLLPTVLAGAVTAALGVGLYGYLGAPGYGDMPLSARLSAMETRSGERPSQEVAQRAFLATTTIPAPQQRHIDLVDQLRAAVADRPEDLRGLALLARNEALLGNFDAAIAAQRQIIDVKGDITDGADLRGLAELMIVATGGYVSPEAETYLRQAATLAPDDGATRYYLGLMHDQAGRADRAFALWQPLFEESVPGDPWYDPIRRQILTTASRAGIRYTLPETRGPSADDMAAAAELPAEDRAAMIEGMVQSLANRLATEGGPPEDWARLITAQAVLGERETAQTILNEARTVFADRADALNLFAQTAAQTGLQ
ncbi:MAG: c-type cytochrome biogenesis protein CcmI [Pseudomonadota bacterium]